MSTRRPTSRARLLGLVTLLLLAAAALVAPAQAAPPNAPTDVTVLPQGNGSLLVLWSPHPAEPDVTAFTVERALGNGGFGQIGTASAFSTAYLDYDYPLAGSVVYRIRAVNQFGELSTPADSAPFTIPIPAFRIIPVSADVTTGADPMTVDVAAAAPAGAAVRWAFGDDTGWVFGATASHTYARPGTYVIAMRAERLAADGSAEVGYAQSIVTVPLAPPTPLAVASDLAATATRRGVVLRWTNPVSSATSLQVNRVNGTRRRSFQMTWDVGLAQTRFVDTTARRGVRYTYTLTAQNGTATATSNAVVITRR